MRYSSIDILRTFAIFSMVIVHFVENLSGSDFVPSGFGAPLFTFLSGVSYRLWLNSQEARGRSDADISKVTIRRGLFLFGVGFLFNVLVWLPEDTYNWDVLTFIGAALMFLNVVRKMPAAVPPLICALVYIASPVMRETADYPAYWINGYFECDLTLSDITLGFLVNGFFPIFPWIIYTIAGFSVATRMFPATRRSSGDMNRFAMLGFGLIAASIATIVARRHVPSVADGIWLKGWTMFPASAEYVLGTLGFAIAAFVLAHRWIDLHPRLGKGGKITQVAATYSTHSFTIYLLHHIVHLWPLWLYGLAMGEEPTEYWRNALPIVWTWALAGLFIVGCYFVLRWMERTGTPGMESLMRWLCD